jgi:hypothetical protein
MQGSWYTETVKSGESERTPVSPVLFMKDDPVEQAFFAKF